MALCEAQLDSALPGLQCGESSEPENTTAGDDSTDSPDKKHKIQPGEGLFALNQGALPLTVDYRSPVSHFIPPEVEVYAAQKQKPEPIVPSESSESPTPVKRKRGRPRIDKTSPEYLAKSAARKQAKEMAAVMNNSSGEPTGEKRKRGRPRIDKTSPEYLARKRQRELEALEKKAKRLKRRATGAKILASKTTLLRSVKRVPTAPKAKVPRKAPKKVARKVPEKKVQLRRSGKFVRRKDSAASSSGETTPRVKRKYTKRAPGTGAGPGRPRKIDAGQPAAGERVKGKRGRPRKADLIAAGLLQQNSKTLQNAKIRVRSNLMPMNSEPISLDSDDEPDLGSPSRTSDSLSLDENLRALRHLHEKYANLDRDDAINAQLLPVNYSAGDERSSTKELTTPVEKLEDSSNSDSDSSSSSGKSGSGSSSSSSSSTSSGSSSSSSDSDSSDDESSPSKKPGATDDSLPRDNDGSFGAWSHSAASPRSGSPSDSSLGSGPRAPASPQGSISESENESPDKSFQCHICRKWYSTLVTLKIHRRGHQARGGGSGRSRARSSDRYECDCCPAAFTRREKLWEHKASAHRGAMTVRCSVCRKCFEDEAELAAHDAAHTPDEREGRCSECGLRFPRHEQLRRHRAAAHGARAHPHTCAQCGKGFGHAHSLTRHLHNHARQLYKCVVCKASFARADQLAQHLNSHLANYKRLKP